jgi:hypothetical protein
VAKMKLRDLENIETKPGNENPQNLEYVLIESRLLDGEKILLAFEKKSLKKLREQFPNIVIYFPPEIKELYKHKDDKEFIKKIHLVKKEFKGWIVPSTNSKGGSRNGDTKDLRQMFRP